MQRQSTIQNEHLLALHFLLRAAISLLERLNQALKSPACPGDGRWRCGGDGERPEGSGLPGSRDQDDGGEEWSQGIAVHLMPLDFIHAASLLGSGQPLVCKVLRPLQYVTGRFDLIVPSLMLTVLFSAALCESGIFFKGCNMASRCAFCFLSSLPIFSALTVFLVAGCNGQQFGTTKALTMTPIGLIFGLPHRLLAFLLAVPIAMGWRPSQRVCYFLMATVMTLEVAMFVLQGQIE